MHYYLLYDATCGMCSFFKSTVMFLDRRHMFVSIELTNPVSAFLLSEIDPILAVKSFHIVSSNGNISSGHEAVPQLFYILTNSTKARRLLATALMRNIICTTYSLVSMLKGASRCGLLQHSNSLFPLRKSFQNFLSRLSKGVRIFNDGKETAPFVNL